MVQVRGAKEVLEQLNKIIRRSVTKTEVGMTKAGLFIKGQAIKKTPVDTGNLRANFYTKTHSSGFVNKKIITEVGNNTEYAAAVHENLESSHKTGEAKYLENAVTENASQILRIIANEARL